MKEQRAMTKTQARIAAAQAEARRPYAGAIADLTDKFNTATDLLGRLTEALSKAPTSLEPGNIALLYEAETFIINRSNVIPPTYWRRPEKAGNLTELDANATLLCGDMLAALEELFALIDDGAFIDLTAADSTPIARKLRAAFDKAKET